jgi:isopenicillin N synthase-like dioxygenase
MNEMSRNNIELPVIEDPSEIDAEQLVKLSQYGFCYVKLPEDEKFTRSHKTVYESGLRFFRQSMEEKMKVAFDQKMFAGYSDRRNKEVSMRFEHFFCRPYDPIGPMKEHKESIKDITDVYHEKIAKPILLQLLSNLGLQDHFHKMTDEYFSSLSFPYYPADPVGKQSDVVREHRDFELITILAVNKPGLQVFLNQQWHDVMPKTGYAIVNLANTFEVMTSGKCKSSLHRVVVPEKDQDRMSMGLFIGLSLQSPVMDLVTGQVLFNTMIKFYEHQLSQHDMQDMEFQQESEDEVSAVRKNM